MNISVVLLDWAKQQKAAGHSREDTKEFAFGLVDQALAQAFTRREIKVEKDQTVIDRTRAGRRVEKTGLIVVTVDGHANPTFFQSRRDAASYIRMVRRWGA
jgi:hypothetical protein